MLNRTPSMASKLKTLGMRHDLRTERTVFGSELDNYETS